VDLQGQRGGAADRLAAVIFRHRALEASRQPGVEGLRRLVSEQPSGLRQRGDLHHHLLHQLKAGDRLAELVPVGGEGDRRLQAGLGQPDGAHRHVQPAQVDRGHGHPETAAGFADHIGRRDADLVEDQLAAGRGADRHVRDVVGLVRRFGAVDQQHGQPVGACHPDQQQPEVGVQCVGDVELAAGHHEVVTDRPGDGPQRAGVRAGLRLRDAEPAEALAGQHRGQVPALLLRRAVPAEQAGHHGLYVERGA
jgi:hypothetical protein